MSPYVWKDFSLISYLVLIVKLMQILVEAASTTLHAYAIYYTTTNTKAEEPG